MTDWATQKRRRRIQDALENSRARDRRAQYAIWMRESPEEFLNMRDLFAATLERERQQEARDPRNMTPAQLREREALIRERLRVLRARSTSLRSTTSTGTPAERIAAARAGSTHRSSTPTRSSASTNRSRPLDQQYAARVLQRTAGLVSAKDRDEVVRQLQRTAAAEWVKLPHDAGQVKRLADGTITFQADRSTVQNTTTKTARWTVR